MPPRNTPPGTPAPGCPAPAPPGCSPGSASARPPRPAGPASPPVIAAGLLRGLVLAVRELAGPVWLDASGDDPDVAAFTALQATASPPDPARIDEICSRVLWARFAPAGTARG